MRSESHSVGSGCDPMDYIVHGLLQARILEWVAFPFSRGSSQPRDQTQVSRIAQSRDQTQVSNLCRQILYQLSHRRTDDKDIGAWSSGESTFTVLLCLPARRYLFCDEDMYSFHHYSPRDEGVYWLYAGASQVAQW